MTQSKQEAIAMAEEFLKWSPSQWNNDGSVNKIDIYVTGYLKGRESVKMDRMVQNVGHAHVRSEFDTHVKESEEFVKIAMAKIEAGKAREAKLVEALNRCASPYSAVEKENVARQALAEYKMSDVR